MNEPSCGTVRATVADGAAVAANGAQVRTCARDWFCVLLLVRTGRASAAAPQIEQELVFCTTEAGKLWALKTLRLERRLIPPCLIFVEARLDICTHKAHCMSVCTSHSLLGCST